MQDILEVLIPVLILIESGGNDKAIGRHGEYGCLQIKPIMVDEVNRICQENHPNRHFEYEDRASRVKSIEMAKIYFEWVTDMQEAFEGEKLNIFDYGLIWNAGYKAWKTRPVNESYLEKLMDHLTPTGRLATTSRATAPGSATASERQSTERRKV